MIFLRHPRAAVAAGVCYGRLDLPPGPEAEAEIARALALMPPVAALLTAPALRCRALSDRIAARDGVAAVIDDRLQELDFGAWEGRDWDAIDRAESDRWAADPWTVAPPGGETFAALVARVAAALAEAPPDAAIVTHAGIIRAARMILTGASFGAVFAAPVPHCRPIPLARPGGDGDGEGDGAAALRMAMDSAGARL
jgi:alpha-ribazole phosphatase